MISRKPSTKMDSENPLEKRKLSEKINFHIVFINLRKLAFPPKLYLQHHLNCFPHPPHFNDEILYLFNEHILSTYYVPNIIPRTWLYQGTNIRILVDGNRQQTVYIISRLCMFEVLYFKGFPGGASGKEPAYQYKRYQEKRVQSWVGTSPGGGRGSPLQYPCLENPMERGAWKATIHRFTKSDTTVVT